MVDANGAGTNRRTPTPRQDQGPHYPVVDFSGYGNDLTGAATDQTPVRPVD